ncbi:GMC family oxidoreductase [Paracoccus shanxieyensis]|uniref:FAD-binding protein n=1 Tax=Paracoccus shanxieyensis TaxID=2675752 RepID=A0A6L6IVP1_9RHOB|nr:GMC family oxidoreductase N-terminal domain-containing protein [Paracoccus shanxieyensis]MTH64293.1 FAD-binding protein [Paracoccus shanxieyensis]MTH87437.1 FAD-binding protein [Paracoccus shanxieyensis]
MQTDILILGGGSAGCVLAARLSEDARLNVTLVEAGRDLLPETPATISARYPGRAYLDPRNLWQGLSARYGGAARRYEQARILGGGSAINALMSNRGAPADYDEWAALGAEGWDWASVLPYFRKLETDRDFSGDLHGDSGPLKIRRPDDAALQPFVAAVMQALQAQGHPIRPDQNGPWQDGVFRGAVGQSDQGTRQPTSLVWLTPQVRARPNLHILCDHQALDLLTEDRRVTGARIAGPQGTSRITAARTILSMGAVHSPAMLLRAGIGPAAELQAMDIAPLADLPVGRNLMEHPSIALGAWLPPALRIRDPAEHHEQGVWRYSSGLAGTGDMHGAILSRSGWHSVGKRIGSIFFWVNKSFSRGQVRLASPDPLAAPQADFNMLSDPRDLQRLKDAIRMGAQALAGHATVFPTSYTPRVARVAGPGRWNALQRGALSALLDAAGPMRAALIHGLVTQGVTLRGLLADDATLGAFVRANVGGTWHASGTCRMGRAGDPAAVTGRDGAVHGIAGLYVVDASLMPSIPCANTNIPTIMLAERIADLLKAQKG